MTAHKHDNQSGHCFPLLTGLLLAFCCWHAVFLIVSIIPVPLDRNDSRNSAVDLYRLGFGGRQQWNMFETIPVLHSMDVRLEGVDDRGEKVAVGCLLPGFKSYSTPENSRYYALFHRLILIDSNVAYRSAYLRKAAELLVDRRGPGNDRKWSLVADVAYIRNLVHSRQDGQISITVTRAFELPIPEQKSP